MAKKKKKSGGWIIAGIIGVLVIIVVIVAMKGDSDKTIAVQTTKVSKRTINQIVSAIGRIQPEMQVKVSSETSGEIIYLGVAEGDTVTKNQILIRIKPDIIETQLMQGRAALNASSKDIEIRQTEMNRLKKELTRIQELFKKNFASQQELDIAEASYKSSVAGYEASTSRYKQSEAALQKVERDADRTSIYAPISGIVTKLNVELGEKVVGTGMMAGTELMIVSDLNTMNAEVSVDENDIILLSKQDSCDIEIDAFPERIFKGVVIEIGHSANLSGLGSQDQVTNFKVKLRLLDIEPRLRPGMSCNSDIITETKKDVLAIPLQAVTVRDYSDDESENDDESDNVQSNKKEENNKKKHPPQIVFLDNKGSAKQIEIKTGISDKGFIEVTDGLSEKDVVISGPYSAIKDKLEDGSKIRIDSNFFKFKKRMKKNN